MSTEYVFDTGTDLGREHMTHLETLLDDPTVAVLEATGIGPGQRCLDLGAGGGSITRWLSSRGCSVVAVDLETTHLSPGPGVEVYRHDINDGLPDSGPYDLIHARLLLTHLPRREEIFAQLVAALAPGGWLVLGEFSGRPNAVLSAPTPADVELYARMQHLSHDVVAPARGISFEWAHQVDARMAAAGLVHITGVEHSWTVTGGSPACLLQRNLNMQVDGLLREVGATEEELRRYRELMLNPEFRAWFYQFVCTRGQMP